MLKNVHVTVYECYSDQTENYQGTEDEVRQQLVQAHPWLANYGHVSLREDLNKLGQSQAFFIDILKWE